MVPNNPVPIMISIIIGIPMASGIVELTEGNILKGILPILIGVLGLVIYLIIIKKWYTRKKHD